MAASMVKENIKKPFSQRFFYKRQAKNKRFRQEFMIGAGCSADEAGKICVILCKLAGNCV